MSLQLNLSMTACPCLTMQRYEEFRGTVGNKKIRYFIPPLRRINSGLRNRYAELIDCKFWIAATYVVGIFVILILS